MNAALRALNRFGLGARTGESAALSDPRGWLEAQLRRENALLTDSTLPTGEDAAAATRASQEARRSRDRAAIAQAGRGLRALLTAERRAVFGRRVATDTPFVERLVAFWSNHLCVSVTGKQQVVPLAGFYEREAIRPHVLGSFTNLVLASARHPAMLVYLDNARSIGPNSPAATVAARRSGQGPARPRGLNENYARELMELHTLGVDGGYTQDDVLQLARVLTGWTVSGAGPQQPGGQRRFAFRPGTHEPGAKVVLGRRYSESGEAEGEAAIRDLCAHPATAPFIATKLVRHFVADDPPVAAVNRVAATFRESGGDLAEVSRALIHLDEAWDPAYRKLRTPQDWVVAMLRALEVQNVPQTLLATLNQLRHAPWAPLSPKGYGDTVGDWADPDSVMNRAELARSVAALARVATREPEHLLEVVDLEATDPLREMLTDSAIPRAERLAIALGGPAFQWR